MSDSPVADKLAALAKAKDGVQAKGLSDELALAVKRSSITTLSSNGVLDTLEGWANSKVAVEREIAPVALGRLIVNLGAGSEPVFLPLLPSLFNLLNDKTQAVRSSAQSAINSFIKICPPEATRQVMAAFRTALENPKGWRGQIGALKAMEGLIKENSIEHVALELGATIPLVEHAMHDTKAEVATAAKKTARALTGCLYNPDLKPHLDALVEAMASPSAVPATIKALSSTTFVSEVTAPVLAVMVPLLIRALKERSTDTTRMTCIVVANLVKLVRDPDVAATYLGVLVPGVTNVATGAAFPEVRAFAATAQEVLKTSGASATTVPPAPRDVPASTVSALNLLLPVLPVANLPTSITALPLLSSMPNEPITAAILEYVGGIIGDLADERNFSTEIWETRALGPYLRYVTGSKEDGKDAATRALGVFIDADKQRFAPDEVDDGSEGELLCNIMFSLAYGGLLLLNHTKLRLHRGHRYGICAGNGQGKSTLMKAIRDGKVEGFPPQSELRTIMVEHALQGEDTGSSIIDFIASDVNLKHTDREKIAFTLRDVGFTDEKQADPVGSLSGGWKMKLELARAMLIGADILLLDEPTNHLDVGSVAWLERYLVSQTQITCLIVSHDSGFLDNVCTDIIHYETKKLAYYKGNLSKFVEKKPEAKSYYTLAATSIKFTFPPPGSLMGVRSNTRAIMKLSHCTFTYPGASKPSLYDVSCALTLSSRVGILGPNGAGKSTLIKLLTGETIAQEGKVEKHPALRVGYVAQHAFHHLEQHLEKTPVAYIQWRFQDGHDREVLEKATRVLSEEDKIQMEKPITGKDGTQRKIELLMGRQKLKKTFQYEIKWQGLSHKSNTWLSRDALFEAGFQKLVQQFDDIESSREGAGTRDNAAHLIKKHLEDVGLEGDHAMYSEVKGLSGGQKVKVVIAATLWNNPQVLILDEPTNFLDREALGGLSVAIRDWGGAVCIISHNMEFVNALCPEIWNVDGGRLTHIGKVGLVEDAFEDGTPSATPGASTTTSAVPSRIGSRVGSRGASASTTPAGSGDESEVYSKVRTKKKKPTRNDIKAQEVRRAQRKLKWLTYGGEREMDTDEEDKPGMAKD